MAVRYRWMICDLLTDDYIVDLPLRVDSYDVRFNQPGVMSARMPITNQRINKLLNRAFPADFEDLSAGPGRVVLHCIRQRTNLPDDLWASYWIWRAKTSQGRKGPPQIELAGMSLDGYFAQVEIDALFERTATDRIVIAHDLVTELQAQPYAGIGVAMQAGTCGITQDLIVKPTDKARYGDTLQKLADQSNGFEYRVDTRFDGTDRVRELVWGFPIISETDTRHDFSQPGNVLEWGIEADALRGGTRYRARGDSVTSDITNESLPQLSEYVEASAHLAAGWPRLDRTVDLPGQTDLTALQGYATWWAETAPGPVRVHSVTVRLGDNPTLTPHRLGDYARIRLVNQRYPRIDGVASFVRSWRVIGMEIRPPQRSNGIETAELLFEEQVSS
ncbi:hypothetical protein ACFYY8_31680 [Streptosporangium sp. NPDC001559]|uniref:hypothetical protein n=1 Tax=Streptosporangium sp. NPDC001559 TaxID=3366187 RepID=UPI0036F0F051